MYRAPTDVRDLQANYQVPGLFATYRRMSGFLAQERTVEVERIGLVQQ